MRPHFTLLFLLCFFGLQAQNINDAFVSPRLLDRIEQQPDAIHDFYVILADRVDAEAMLHQFQNQRTNLSVRTAQVITTLQAKAAATQVPVLELINNHPGLVPNTVKPLWITNMIVASGTADLIAALSNHPAVELVELDVEFQLDAVVNEGPAPVSPNGIENGLAAINAPAMWDLGYTGYGTIAFTSDTGVDPWHPSLWTKYRGIYTPVNEAFLGASAGLPYDCDDHGTHVTGTMVGLDRNSSDTIGVAYNAQWIGAPSICGAGTSTMEAFQWALNPDGDISTTDDMPTVINNSWWDPGSNNECTSAFVSIFNALEAAGIAVVFSAGNAGPGVSTITAPKNINTDLVNVFCVGNLNGNTASLTISNSSSRGPSICGLEGSLYIKPEVSAPGSSVRSSVPGGGYANFSGTSMAAPHASGAILLLKEAFPEASGTDIKLALYFSATDLGDPGEDNVYGMGIINLEAAFNYMVDQGFTPADPIVANDLLLYDLKSNQLYCNGTNFEPTIKVENSGTQDIETFTVAYWMEGGDMLEYEWNGLLAAGERLTLTIPGPEIEPTGDWLYVEVLSVNGVADDRSLNNKLQLPIETIDKDALAPYTLATETGTFCTGTTAFLRAEGDGPGSAEFSWYDVAEGGIPLMVGDVFETPVLTEATTYYVDATYIARVGNESPELGDTDIEDLSTDGQGLIFDADQPFELRSVLVDAPQPGPRIIELRDGEGSLISTKFAVIEEEGLQRLDLGINVPVGNNLRLVLGAGLPFKRTISGFEFPYILEDYLEIERSLTTFGGTTQVYNYFHDWEIVIAEPCGRVAYEVIPADLGPAPEAQFSVASEVVEIGEAISFNNETQNGEEWLWVFGDGNSSFEFEPTHSFQQTGIYSITLSATNAVGCTDVASLQVEVTEMTTSVDDAALEELEVQLFPNPTDDALQVVLPQTVTEEVNYRIFDPTGRIVSTGFFAGSNGEISTVDLPAGFYFLELRTGDQRITQKFLVQH
jgi:subtilisin family serine protease